MSAFDRRVSIECVLIMVVLLSSSKGGMSEEVHVKVSKSVQLHVEVTNSLEGNSDLTVSCENIDPTQHLLQSNASYQWDYSGSLPFSKPPFFCSFRWGLQDHIYNLVVPLWDFDCKQHCHWVIRESGPCKYYSTKLVCFKWLKT
ncbi:hypothetical protein V8G54_019422 [Vigna mungo]|uniref:S-protein homolog n=1 Tax=Vigna mungo TaxID=3915 RepID=A0AAQ3RVN2_VIGMU